MVLLALLHMWVCCGWWQVCNVVGNNWQGGDEGDDGGLERCIIDTLIKYHKSLAKINLEPMGLCYFH